MCWRNSRKYITQSCYTATNIAAHFPVLIIELVLSLVIVTLANSTGKRALETSTRVNVVPMCFI